MLDADGKIAVVRGAAARTGYRVFVETGTATGYTLAGVLDCFERLYSVELNHDFYLASFRKFAPAPKVTCLWGASEIVLWHILAVLTEPAVFWLDAHFVGSGARGTQDTPIRQELRQILAQPFPHLLLIDDARLFGTDPAYPTVEWVQSYVRRFHGRWRFELEDDIMRIVPTDL